MPVTRKNTVVAIVLGVFFALHVLASALLQGRAPIGAAPAREEARIPLHD
jgi:hypothetical protein